MKKDEILNVSLGDSEGKNALKMLSTIDLEAKSKRYPNVPRVALPRIKFTDTTSNKLTKAIIKFLSLNGHYCSRIQSQGQYQPNKGIWTRSTVKRGIGDIMAIVSSKTVMIEVKVGKDKQSKWQSATQKEVERSGGSYFIAKDFDSFIEWYNSIKNK